MIFYFTGTGNSLYVAKELDPKRISIPQVMHQDNLIFEADSIGIVCPIYGHEMPAMVKEFIKKATFKTSYFYLVLTYGAMHGGAVEIAAKFLKSVGKQADYITTILMVDNFLPNFDMAEQGKLEKREEEHIAAIKQDISEKKMGMQKVGMKDRAVHKMYTSFVKNQPETIWADYKITNDCIGCGICMKVCPAGCIYLEEQMAIHTLENCQACMACIHACPQKAVQFNSKEVNPDARYRNEHISLSELVSANNQTDFEDKLQRKKAKLEE